MSSNGPGHVIKVAAMPIYGKKKQKTLKIFSETSRMITFELGIQHLGFWPYKVCSLMKILG